MKEKVNKKNLIIIGVLVVIIGIAGYFYSTRDQTSDTLLSSEFSTTTTVVDSDLLSALRELKKLRLDDSIFTNPVWMSLNDFGKTLADQPKGRPNPFLPLDLSGAGTTTGR